MSRRLYLAVEAPEEDMVRVEVDRFLGMPMVRLSVYPLEISYDVVEVRRAADENGGIDPSVERDILQALAEKDAEIAEAFQKVSRFASESGRVVAALSDPDDDDVFLSKKWAEAFATQGRSVTAHHTSYDDEAEWAVREFKRALQLTESGFHDRVGFFDAEQLDPAMYALRDRVKFAPDMQWVATVDLTLGGNEYAAKIKIQNRLENTIDNLTEYIRDLCIKHHDAPFEACPQCTDVLNAAGRITNLFSDNTPVTVCMTHRRFVPCRRCDKPTPEVWSSDPDDVEMVRRFQQGDT